MSESLTKIYKPKVRFESSNRYNSVKGIVKKNNLHTVCEEARCPNIFNVGIEAIKQ